jgi:hypothetical protein
MIDDGLKYLFAVAKTLFKSALKGEAWALVIIGIIVIICILSYLKLAGKRLFESLSIKYHPYEEIDDNQN